jgi:hypothetical protein
MKAAAPLKAALERVAPVGKLTAPELGKTPLVGAEKAID